MDPGNARATAGIANLLVFYRSYAYRACSAGQWTRCGIIVRAGLSVDGQDEYLLQLQDAAAAGETGGSPALPPAPAAD
jgi:hypothetical protein